MSKPTKEQLDHMKAQIEQDAYDFDADTVIALLNDYRARGEALQIIAAQTKCCEYCISGAKAALEGAGDAS